MKYYSTNFKTDKVSFEEALFQGLAPDGGLYMPESFPTFSAEFFNSNWEYPELATELIAPFVECEIDKKSLLNICNSAFDFPIPLIDLEQNIHILELFHGPTFAFKDFAARFMARTMQFFMKNKNVERTVLVATSGDTGSAVANGFYKMEGINVVILYPSGRVSEIQEHQLTTLGENILAIEVEGSFDDCQKIVKTAFLDSEIRNQKQISSANSINISRLLPQSIYFTWAWICARRPKDVIISVPSGNFGNLTGGLIAKKMGLPITKFLAAVNSNDVFPKYLQTGKYKPKPSKQTLSNAMDVGNPSNFARIQNLYQADKEKINKDILSLSIDNDLTIKEIKEIKNKFNYLADPHTAVGLNGLKNFLGKNQTGIVLSTAHPGKFADVIEPIIGEKIKLPNQLEASLKKEKKRILIPNNYEQFKSILLD